MIRLRMTRVAESEAEGEAIPRDIEQKEKSVADQLDLLSNNQANDKERLSRASIVGRVAVTIRQYT